MNNCWKLRKLGELLARPLAYGVLKPGPHAEGGVPMIKIQDHQSGKIQTNDLHRIPPSLHKEFKRTELNGGEIIVSVVGSIGRTAIIPDHLKGANVSRAFAVIGCNEDIETRFLNQYLNFQKVQSWFKEQCQGNAQQVLNLGTLKELEVPVPPLPEQKKIAEILSGIDQCISEQKKKIDAVTLVLENTSSQLLDDISEDPSTNHKRIDEVSNLKGGNGFPVEHQGMTHGGTPFIKVSDFNKPGNENEIRTANNYLSEKSMSSLRPYVFPTNTIVFAKVGAALTSNRRRILSEPTCIDNNLMGAIPGDIEPLYLKLLFEKIDFNQFCQDGAVPSVNQSQIGCIEVPIPSIETQKRIVLATESFRATMRALVAKKEKLVALKNALSSDLLSGRKRVSI